VTKRDYQVEYNRRISTPQGRAKLYEHRRNQGARQAERARERYAEHRHDLYAMGTADGAIFLQCDSCSYRTDPEDSIELRTATRIQADHTRNTR